MPVPVQLLVKMIVKTFKFLEINKYRENFRQKDVHQKKR